MSDAAKHLLRLICWLEVCQSSRRLDEEAYETAWRVREQAAYLIGFCA